MSRRNHTELHVSTEGSDRAAGTRRDPLATPHGALAAIRRKGKRPAGPITVVLHGGTYSLPRTLRFGPQDSGKPGAPLIFRAATGEAVTLSGGVRISGWRKGRVNGKACWVTDLPDVKANKWNFTQLFVDGKRRPRARLPKSGWYRFTDYVKESDRTPKWFHGPKRMRYGAGDLKRWRNLGDVRLIAPEYWFVSHHRIRRVDTRRRIVHFKTHSVASLSDEKQKCARFVVESVFEALNTPGEWYLDRKSGRLYYIPLPHEQPDTTEVIAPRLDEVVRFAGTTSKPVSHIHLENLSLQPTEWDYPDDDPGCVQAAEKVPGGIVLRAARHCVLYGCEVAHMAGYGIETRNGCHDNRVVHCALHDLGGGGVRIGHEWMPRIDETSMRIVKPISDLRSTTTVSDCRVHDIGRIHMGAIGIWIGNAGGNRVLHNHIFDVPYTGISCGWTWGYAPTATVDNQIEGNHIHHVAWDRQLSDNGAIYTLGNMAGTTIRGNHVHHVGCYGYGGTGIYLDEGSSDVRVENNVINHTTNAGCMVHYGRDIVVRNNIFAMAKTQHVRPGNRADSRSIIFVDNIFYWTEGQLERTSWGLEACEWAREHYLFARNVFFNANGKVEFGGERSFEQLQAAGQHLDTVIADPLFADPAGGDFTLRDDSPALKAGYKPPDLSGLGPRMARTRPERYAKWPLKVPGPRAVVRTIFEQLSPTRVRMKFVNVGLVTASGRLRIEAGPNQALKIRGNRSFGFKNLKPGAERSEGIDVRIEEGDDVPTLESIPASPCLVPALLHLVRPGN